MPITLPNVPSGMDEFLKAIKEGSESRATDLKNKNEMAFKKQLMDMKMPLLAAQIEELKTRSAKNSASANGSNDKATKANQTANQKVIQAVKNTLPVIDELIGGVKEIPGQGLAKYFKINKQANYEGKTIEGVDNLMAGLGWPKIKESIHMAKKLMQKRAGETDENYVNRMKSLRKRLESRMTSAAEANKKGYAIDAEPMPEIGSDEQSPSTNDTNSDDSNSGNYVINENGEMVEA